ncbi:ParB/RepB/Spo0J family partition protein [Oceanicaulis sp.]|uniref:ParB/RepB/Spo0J family partition protein n=1 Tax=Oceanicaulis sp. TaxID=1924941 RepID=UPI003F717FFC
MALSPDDLRLIAYAAEEADLHQSGEMDFHEAATAIGKLPQNVKRSWKRLNEAGFVRSKPLVVSDEARLELAEHTRKLDQSDGIPADMIDPDPDQPRTIFNAEDMQELINSISAKGLLKPLLIRSHPDLAKHYAGRRMLVDGERRLLAIRAAIKNGALPEHYRAQVSYDRSSKTPGDRILTQLGVNLTHSKMNPMELSDAFERLANEHGLSNPQIAESLGKTPEYVQQYRKLQKLGDEDKALMRANQLGFTEARKKLTESRAPAKPASLPPTAPPAAETASAPAVTSSVDNTQPSGPDPRQTAQTPPPHASDWFAPRAGGSAASPLSDAPSQAQPPALTGDALVRDARLTQIEADTANALKRARRALHDPESTGAEKAELETAIGYLEAVQNHLTAARNAIKPQTTEMEPQS